jgi:hypothetical protein
VAVGSDANLDKKITEFLSVEFILTYYATSNTIVNFPPQHLMAGKPKLSVIVVLGTVRWSTTYILWCLHLNLFKQLLMEFLRRN